MIDQLFITYLRKMSPNAMVYTLVLPENYTLPAIVYHRTNIQQSRLHDGTGVSNSSIKLDIWTATYAEAVQISSIVKPRMLQWQTLGQISRMDSENTTFEPGLNIFRTSLTFRLQGG